jgi:dynein light intermediate chain 2
MATYSRAPAPSAKEDRVKDLWTVISSDLRSPSSSSSSVGSQSLESQSGTDLFSVFLGELGAGKSTLIQSFMGKEEPPKPTVALEYQFARRPRPGSTTGAKDVAHVWELGGGLPVRSLVGVPVQQALDSSAAVIVLDMARAADAVPALAKWLGLLGRRVREGRDALAKSSPERAEALDRKSVERFGAAHPDLPSVRSTLLPIPVLVVLNKYGSILSKSGNPLTPW